MRDDAIGLFWEDLPPVKKQKKEIIKKQPPEPIWLKPNYLPNLEQAKNSKFDLYTDDELIKASINKEKLIYDIECYINYFIVAFKGFETGKIIYFEKDINNKLDIKKLQWILENFTLIDFNGNHYDIPILSLALKNKSNEVLKQATNEIITYNIRSNEVLKSYKTRKLKLDNIDIKNVAPLKESLKTYAGRINARCMQDLPFDPDFVLTEEQKHIVRWYCVNDLDNTGLLFKKLSKEINLRVELGKEYGLDLRSKSDAQIAESVINKQVNNILGYWPKKPDVTPGERYLYNVPHFIKFKTDLMNYVLKNIKNNYFGIDNSGKVVFPEIIKNCKKGINVTLNKTTYTIGAGGLHSTEKSISHYTTENEFLVDKDVTSYYPRIILNLGLFPTQIGKLFLKIYNDIVERRVLAKENGDKLTASTLKIVINGSYGKFGSAYSSLYAPSLLFHVTITGQLALLMLIESLELSGIPVVSANTDGVVIKCPFSKKQLLDYICNDWQKNTNFNLESTYYKSLHSRDVNNYIAINANAKTINDIKTKGVYGDISLYKNPTNRICNIAVKEFLLNGVKIEDTINNCHDIDKFITIKKVKGGGVYAELNDKGIFENISYIGKVVRWYYSNNPKGELVYSKTGNKVARAEGVKPLMLMDGSIPKDLNRDWYVKEAYKILNDIGALNEKTGIIPDNNYVSCF